MFAAKSNMEHPLIGGEHRAFFDREQLAAYDSAAGTLVRARLRTTSAAAAIMRPRPSTAGAACSSCGNQ